MPFSSPSPTLCNVETEVKLCIHFVCRVGEGGGGDQSCVAKKKRLNRLFVASHSRGKKPPYWKARYALGKDKQKEITIFKNDVKLFSSCPIVSPTLQHGGQLQVENFSKQNVSR